MKKLMPEFGNITNPSIDILKEINTIGKLGLNFIEIGLEEPSAPELLLKKRKQILKILKKYDMFATGHAPWWAELGTSHNEVRKGWVTESKKMINVAKNLGIKKLNFHMHARGMVMRTDKYKKIILDNYVSSLKELTVF